MSKIPSDHMDALADIGGKTPALAWFAFAPVTGSPVLTGFFVDAMGRQTGNRITPYTISAAVNFATAVVTIPANAIGFIGTLSGAVYYNLSANSDGTRVQDPASGDPQLAATNLLQLGRVG